MLGSPASGSKPSWGISMFRSNEFRSTRRPRFFPTPELFPNDPVSVPDKIAHMVQDVRRLTRELGLTLRFPTIVDPDDWSISHAAFLGAEQQGGGHRMMLELFRKRWSEGLDLGEDGVIADAAKKANLDPVAVLEAAHSDALRAIVSDAWRLAGERDHSFGVPSFVFAGKLYWGQDRMHFVRSAVDRKLSGAS